MSLIEQEFSPKPEIDVPGEVQWTTAPVGRVAVNPCTGARTVITRGPATAPPPDIPAVIRVDPRDDQDGIRNKLKLAWATGVAGTLTPPLTTRWRAGSPQGPYTAGSVGPKR